MLSPRNRVNCLSGGTDDYDTSADTPGCNLFNNPVLLSAVHQCQVAASQSRPLLCPHAASSLDKDSYVATSMSVRYSKYACHKNRANQEQLDRSPNQTRLVFSPDHRVN